MEVAEPNDDSNHESKVTHTQPQTLLGMIVFLVLGNMRRSGCGYHFAKRTTNYGGYAHRKAAYSWSPPLLEVRGFPIALKGHTTEVPESL